MAQPGEVIKVKLELMPPLSRLSGKMADITEEVNVGATVKDLLIGICSKHRELGEVIFHPRSGQLSGQVNILLNGLFLELQQGMETRLVDGDVVSLLPAFVGGSLILSPAREIIAIEKAHI